MLIIVLYTVDVTVAVVVTAVPRMLRRPGARYTGPAGIAVKSMSDCGGKISFLFRDGDRSLS
jgi:hypothetical protein